MDYYQKSLKVINKLVTKDIYKNAQKIAIYKNLNENEVNTNFILYNHIISENKEVFWIDTDNFDTSCFDLVILPILKYSSDCFYLSRININFESNVIGLTFEENQVDYLNNSKKIQILTEKNSYNV